MLKVISRSTFDLKTVLPDPRGIRRRSSAKPIKGNHQRSPQGEKDPQRAGYIEPPASASRRGIRSIHPRSCLSPGNAARRPRSRAPEGAARSIFPMSTRTPITPFVQAREAGSFRLFLAVPMLRREGEAIGVLTLSRGKRRGRFTDKQIELVSTFADQAAIAIENVRLFDQVQARTRELAAWLEDLRTTQDRLVQTQKLALLGQLTAGIAHEIKNPLNFVNNFSGVSAELINELQDTLKGIPLNDKARTEINELTDTLKGNFDKVMHHGRRADAIVKNMLQHSREGSGEHRVIDVNALVEESLNLAWHGVRAEMQGFEVKLKQSFDPSAGAADIFPRTFGGLFLNMISNGFYAATRRRAEAQWWRLRADAHCLD